MHQRMSMAVSPRTKSPGQSFWNCIAPVGVSPELPGKGICVMCLGMAHALVHPKAAYPACPAAQASKIFRPGASPEPCSRRRCCIPVPEHVDHHGQRRAGAGADSRNSILALTSRDKINRRGLIVKISIVVPWLCAAGLLVAVVLLFHSNN